MTTDTQNLQPNVKGMPRGEVLPAEPPEAGSALASPTCSHSNCSNDGESSDDAIVGNFGSENNASNNLAVVGNYEGVMSFIINAAKKKGVRLVEDDFMNDDVKRLDHHVGIFTGDFCKTIDSILEGGKRCVSSEKSAKNVGLDSCGTAGNIGMAHDSYANAKGMPRGEAPPAEPPEAGSALASPTCSASEDQQNVATQASGRSIHELIEDTLLDLKLGESVEQSFVLSLPVSIWVGRPSLEQQKRDLQ